jgi:hypothetical protein
MQRKICEEWRSAGEEGAETTESDKSRDSERKREGKKEGER